MAKTERLGITLPDDNTNVTTQFFIDRFKEIEAGAETPKDAQLKVDKLKELAQNKKITADDGTPLIKLKSGQDLRDEMIKTTPFFAVIQAEPGVTNVPESVFLQGIKLFSTPTNGFVMVQTKTNQMYINHCQSSIWSGWIRMDNGERIFISPDKLVIWENIGIGRYSFVGTTMRNMPISNDDAWYTLDVDGYTENNLPYRQFTLRRNYDNRMWIGSNHGRTFSGWKEVITKNSSGIVEQEGWKNLVLQNGWVPYGADDPYPQYYKDNFGVVHLKGVIKDGNTPIGTVITTLPVGYRPSERLIVSTYSSITSPLYSRLAINPNGTINVLGGSVGNNWLYLMCSFRL